VPCGPRIARVIAGCRDINATLGDKAGHSEKIIHACRLGVHGPATGQSAGHSPAIHP